MKSKLEDLLEALMSMSALAFLVLMSMNLMPAAKVFSSPAGAHLHPEQSPPIMPVSIASVVVPSHTAPHP